MSVCADGVERVIIEVEQVSRDISEEAHVWKVVFMRLDEEGQKRIIYLTGKDELDIVRKFPDHVNYNLDIHKFDAGHEPTNWKGI